MNLIYLVFILGLESTLACIPGKAATNYSADGNTEQIPRPALTFQPDTDGACVANGHYPPEFLKTLKHRAAEAAGEVMPAFRPVEATARSAFRSAVQDRKSTRLNS